MKTKVSSTQKIELAITNASKNNKSLVKKKPKKEDLSFYKEKFGVRFCYSISGVCFVISTFLLFDLWQTGLL